MSALTRRVRLLAVSLALVAIAAGAVVVAFPALVTFGDAIPPGSGVKLKITGVAIPADRKPVVTFNLTDAAGSPIRVSDTDANGIRFIIAAIKTDSSTGLTSYVNYITRTVAGANYDFNGSTKTPALASAMQDTADTGGVFAELGSGKVTYTFAAALPAGFSVGDTHVVGAYATRSARKYISNDVFSFVPSGAPVTVNREVVKTENCNKCHDKLVGHGARIDTHLCVLCHTVNSVEPNSGNTVDFKQFIHKLHSGASLPSVVAGTPYFIGNGTHNFSDIVFPQDTRNCQTCHAGAAQGDNYKTKPSAEACGSCHDSVDFKTGKNHGGGAQLNNSACATCHPADGPEFGLSVTGAHTIPEKSKQLRGVNFTIVSFTNTTPGQNPTVTFNIKDNAGVQIQPSEMTALAFVLSGPTTDYASPAVTENAITQTVTTADGNLSYTFAAKIPTDAKGTFAVGIQGYMTKQLKKFNGDLVKDASGRTDIRDAGFNKVAYGAVTDKVPQARKQVVDVKNCNQCHETLSFHGGSRLNPEYCILCHNAQNSDADRRAAANGPTPASTLSFNNLIHTIHTGVNRQGDPFLIYGGSPTNLSVFRYPTTTANCTKCHVPNSNLLSFVRSGIQPTTVKLGGKVVSQTGAIQTICMGCHTSTAAGAHMDTMTAGSATREACTVCHNEGRDNAVSTVHAQ